MSPGEETLLDALERFLRGATGVVVPRDAWDWCKVPDHLRPTFRVVDEQGKVVAAGKDLEALKAPLRPKFAAAMAEAAADSGLTVTGQTTWTFGTVERTFTQVRAGHEVRGFPALVDEGTTVGMQVFGSDAEQEAAHRRGLRRLLMLAIPSPAKKIAGALSNTDKLGLAGSPYPSVTALLEDCVAAAVDDLVVRHGGLVWDEASYDGLRTLVARDLEEATRGVMHDVIRVLAAWRDVERLLSGSASMALLSALADMKAQVGRLVFRGFVSDVGVTALRQLPRYLAAVTLRRQRLDGERRPRPAADGPGRQPAGRLPAPGRGAARRAAAERRPGAGALAARGVPRQPVGAAARHRPAGLRHPDPQGPRRALTRPSPDIGGGSSTKRGSPDTDVGGQARVPSSVAAATTSAKTCASSAAPSRRTPDSSSCSSRSSRTSLGRCSRSQPPVPTSIHRRP